MDRMVEWTGWLTGARSRERGAMSYYHFVRREIAPLLPKNPTRILEVGAGAGGTLGWLKTLYPNAQTTAVEINPALRHELEQNADVVIIGPIDENTSQLQNYN